MLLTTKEAAEVLRMPAQSLYRLVRDGIVPAVHVGRRIRISREALEAFIRDGGRALPGGWRREPRENPM